MFVYIVVRIALAATDTPTVLIAYEHLSSTDVTVSLRDSSSEEFESGLSVEYCVAVDGVLERNVTVFINTINGSAHGKN